MAWEIDLSGAARRHLKDIDPPQARRILSFLYERLALLDDPRSLGEALKGARLAGLWKYRVGDYRVIASIEDGRVRILILRIGHRRAVYR